jgi:excisionase family DNA binding protein
MNFSNKTDQLSKKLDDQQPQQVSMIWLTGDEICKLLRVSKRTLQNYRDRKSIPFSQIGRKIYYKYSDINEYLEMHHIKPNYQKGDIL